jgi:hypothetical protein
MAAKSLKNIADLRRDLATARTEEVRIEKEFGVKRGRLSSARVELDSSASDYARECKDAVLQDREPDPTAELLLRKHDAVKNLETAETNLVAVREALDQIRKKVTELEGEIGLRKFDGLAAAIKEPIAEMFARADDLGVAVRRVRSLAHEFGFESGIPPHLFFADLFPAYDPYDPLANWQQKQSIAALLQLAANLSITAKKGIS